MEERDVLKVDFFLPGKIPFPKFTAEDYLKQTAEDMLHLLQAHTHALTVAPLSLGPPIINAFAELASILGRATAPPPTAPLPSPPLAPTRTTTTTTTLAPVPAPRVPVASPRVVSQFPPTPTQKLPTQKLPAMYKPPIPGRFPVGNRYSRTGFNPRQPFFQQPNPFFHNQGTRLQFAPSIQHDPTVSGKMFDPTTGRAETIDSLLHGPDHLDQLLV
jgi:hypothetical protein